MLFFKILVITILLIISIIVSFWLFLRILLPEKTSALKNIFKILGFKKTFLVLKNNLYPKLQKSVQAFEKFISTLKNNISKTTLDSLKIFGIQFVFLFFINLIMLIFIEFKPITLPEKFEKAAIILILISIYLLPLGMLIYNIKLLFRSVYMVNKYINVSTKGKIRPFFSLLILMRILLILITPIISFAIIYGVSRSIIDFPIEYGIEKIFGLENIYYSIAISYSLPSDNIIELIQAEMDKKTWLKIIPSIQVIFQKIIDVFLLGYIATILITFIQNSQKNNK